MPKPRRIPLAMKTRILLFLITLVCAAAASMPSVYAATITVQDTGDGTANAANCPGSGCRLRDALAAATDGDTINFSVTTPATITLTSGQLVVGNSVAISGPGADQLSVNGNAASLVFYINSGLTVTISGLTITNGSADNGSGIYNDHSNLTVSSSTVSDNSASYGGGIFNDGGFDGLSFASLTINTSTVSGNSASVIGGGILNFGPDGIVDLTINNSTVSGNLATSGGDGGGIYNDGFDGLADLTINNSTVSGNSATSGGGIYNSGGGFPPFFQGLATVTIQDTILNAGASGENIYNDSGAVTSQGYNLSSDNGGGFLTATGDQINTNPMLGPLQDNGGPTFTHALLSGSPAIDKGDPNFNPNDFNPPMLYDQRGPGFPRVVNNRIDIGAFEVQTIVCPQGKGYWKNNPNAWPVSSLMLGSQTYTKSELLTILRTPIKGDASLILADQLIAAKLNIASGADGTPVTSTITHADFLLSSFSGKLPYKVKPSTSTGQAMVNDAATLNDYNNGLLTSGCGG